MLISDPFQYWLYEVADQGSITIIDFRTCHATCWEWRKSRRHKSSLCERDLFPVNAYKKNTTPYFLWRFKNVEEVEEKVPSVGEMFCSWIIILRHDGIGYNITDDITRVGDSLTTGNQFPMPYFAHLIVDIWKKFLDWTKSRSVMKYSKYFSKFLLNLLVIIAR